MIDNYISILYKKIFNADLKNNKLYLESVLISNSKYKILEFLGLCYREYKKGFKKQLDIYEYIKGSHYFNNDLFFDDANFRSHLNIYPKQRNFEWEKYDPVKLKNNLIKFFNYF